MYKLYANYFYKLIKLKSCFYKIKNIEKYIGKNMTGLICPDCNVNRGKRLTYFSFHMCYQSRRKVNKKTHLVMLPNVLV